jgi:tripartite-type tricarboxylate transporter receptor subunit TctC
MHRFVARAPHLSPIFAAVVSVFLGTHADAQAPVQEWPRQAVRLIVPFSAGAGNDVAARIVADGLSRRWGKPVIIENKPGGETTIGVAAFAGTRDDHTLLYTVFGSLTVAPLTVERLSYDADNDLVPIAPTASVVVVVSVNSGLPVHSLADLERVARAQPGQLSWASGTTLPRYAFATFLKQRGLEMTYVGYRDTTQPQADLGEGRIHALITGVTASSAPVALGKSRFIAITEPQRSALLPDVPTAAESSYDELTFIGGAGLFGWKGMPDALRARLNDDVNAVLGDPALRQKLTAAGQQAIGGAPEKLSALIAEQRKRVLEIARTIDLRAAR